MLKKVVVTVAAIAALIVGGTWLYINVIKEDAPEKLSFEQRDREQSTPSGDSTDTSNGTDTDEGAAVDVEGAWSATEESEVGYRVQEILFGQETTAVGRSNDVAGSIVIEGSDLTAADFSVPVATITSDESRRDSKFRSDIMDSENFPNATFALTETASLGKIPADNEEITVTATGDLTLRGETRSVSFPLNARRNGATIEVNGSIPILFSDYGIDNPSGGPVSTEDNGELEFLLVLARGD